jgi:hypothetical protein
MQFQVTVGLIQAVVAAGLKIVMAKSMGLPGVIWASVIMTFLGAGVVFLYVRGLLTRIDESVGNQT